MGLKILPVVLSFSFGSAVWAAPFAQSQQQQSDYSYADPTLNQKKCSGHVADMNCYADIIQDSAHRMNVKEGYEEPRPGVVYEQGPLGYPQSLRKIKKKAYKGQRVLIDTQDRRSCEEVQKYVGMLGAKQAKRPKEMIKESLMDLESMCEPSKDRYREITIMQETSEDYLTPIKLSFFKNTMDTLGIDTRNLTNVLVGAVGLIWVLPESISKWDKEEVKATGLLNKWKENVQSGPVWDKDEWAVNYIGHPLSGAAYYTIARTNGASPLASFGYSVLISTFVWEYGFEAFAEIPSIQDLILTPVLGSLLGEVFYKLQEGIKANGGKFLDSYRLGSIALVFLNPGEALSDSINKIVGSKLIQNSETNLVVGKRPIPGMEDKKSGYIGLEIQFKFK